VLVKSVLQPRPLFALVSLTLGFASCEAPTPQTRRAALAAPSPGLREHRLRDDRPELRIADGLALVRGRWGSAPGELGRVLEASQPGPMSLTVDREGRVHLLDQVNRRIQRFDRQGRWLGMTSGVAETSEDLVLTGEVYRILVYQPGSPPRYRIDSLELGSGRRRASFALPPELLLATRLIATGDPARPELSLELSRRETVLVARGEQAVVALDGRRPPPLLGRSGRQPAERLLGRRSPDGRSALVERVFPGRYTSGLVRLTPGDPILALEAFEVGGGALALGLVLDRSPCRTTCSSRSSR
jgi:hypothetical protein